jgi:hypothetical protein
MKFIFSSTPPAVARAVIEAWQKKREDRFLADLAHLVAKHEKRGLEKRRMASIAQLLGKMIEKVSGART